MLAEARSGKQREQKTVIAFAGPCSIPGSKISGAIIFGFHFVPGSEILSSEFSLPVSAPGTLILFINHLLLKQKSWFFEGAPACAAGRSARSAGRPVLSSFKANVIVGAIILLIFKISQASNFIY